MGGASIVPFYWIWERRAWHDLQPLRCPAGADAELHRTLHLQGWRAQLVPSGGSAWGYAHLLSEQVLPVANLRPALQGDAAPASAPPVGHGPGFDLRFPVKGGIAGAPFAGSMMPLLASAAMQGVHPTVLWGALPGVLQYR